MKNVLFIAITTLLISTAALAEIPEKPVPPRLVNDFAGVLSAGEQSQLESSLVQFSRETSTQIVVVTVKDLDGDEPAEYAFRLGEKWGIGQKGKDNGIVILLKPKQGNSKGQVFIATGYGLEGVLPDAVVNGTVVDKEMIPHFMENDYYQGLASGIKVIMDISRGEYSAEEYKQNYAKQNDGVFPGILFFIVIFIIVSALRGRRNRFYSPGKSLPFWIALGMMSGRNSRGGSFGNFSSGGGSFGGFGGGSFGGGGAGGSW
jgi:uncharacterized protein